MFETVVWNVLCCHHTLTRGDCSIMSSRTSDQPLRRPDGRTCWVDGDAAPRADDDWRNVDADDWRRQRRMYSRPPGTGELCVVDTDELSDRAWTELDPERRASASRHEEDVPSHEQVWERIQGSRIRSVRILFYERYVRTLTYSILAYVNNNRIRNLANNDC